MTVLTIEHIVATPDICGGKPRIEGTRVRVQDVVAFSINGGWSAEQIAEEVDVTPAQVYAALSYYYDHQAEIDSQIADGKALMEQHRPEADARRRDLIDRARAKGIQPPDEPTET